MGGRTYMRRQQRRSTYPSAGQSSSHATSIPAIGGRAFAYLYPAALTYVSPSIPEQINGAYPPLGDTEQLNL